MIRRATQGRWLVGTSVLLVMAACNTPDPGADAGDMLADARVDGGTDAGRPDAGLDPDGGPLPECLEGCLVEDVCYPAGAHDPVNPCLICDPAVSRAELTPDDGATCDDGRFCTVDDVCAAGACGGAYRSCDDGIACNGTETCESTSDACEPGAPTCTDEQICDALSGSCVLECAGCSIGGTCYGDGQVNPLDPCQACETALSTTEWSPNDGGSCDDGDFCTVADTCSAGVCGGGAARECGDGVGCNGAETCDTAARACVPGVTTCNPAQICDAATDACVATCTGCVIDGTCYGAGQRNPDNQCEVCAPLTSASSFSSNDGASCDDGLFCTDGDACAGTSCVGAARECADGIACNGAETCDEAAGACVAGSPTCLGAMLCDPALDTCITTCTGCVIDGSCYGDGQVNPMSPCEVCDVASSSTGWSDNDGARCDDGAFCTESDLCAAGVCAGTARSCSDGVSCNGTELCDEGLGACIGGAPTCAATEVCDSAADACVTTCAGCVIDGVCFAAATQNPANPCHVCDTTRSRADWSMNDGAACDDGAFCTTGDVCSGGLCAGSSAVSFCADAVSCNGVETCNEATDRCVAGATTCAAGQVCDTETNLCLTACSGCVIGGVCYADATRNPTDQCQVCDTDASTSAWTANAGATCDDGLFCTASDVCDASAVCSGAPRSCDDGVTCNGVESCNESAGRCALGTPTCAAGQVCDAALNMCILTCSGCAIGGVCQADGAVNPANPCEVCDASSSASAWTSNTGAVCDDGLFCTTNEVCSSSGTCGAGVGRACSDGVACNGTETCSEAAGRCVLGTATCPDGRLCDTMTDTCEITCSGCVIDDVCYPANAPNPSNPCEVCRTATSITAWTADVGASCDDRAYCTVGDVCSAAGECAGGAALSCGDGVSCNGTEVCNETTDRCDAGAPTCGPGEICNTMTNACQITCSGCVIDGVCHAAGTFDPSNPCARCMPSSSSTAWTADAGRACDDGLYCTTGETCSSVAVCDGGTARDCGDGVACNGAETCNELTDRCVAGATTCTGGESCDVATDTCVLSCVGGTSLCGTSCVDTAITPAHCGTCDMACTAGVNAVPVCVDSGCRAFCDDGFSDCDGASGCETVTRTDEANCGACGRACGPEELCAAGACVAGFATTAVPLTIPSSAGCALLQDSNADQIDVTSDGSVFVLLRCGAALRMSVSTDVGRSFAAPTTVDTGLTVLPEAATVFARSERDVFVLFATAPEAHIVRSTDGGSTWTTPVLVTTEFANAGPGPAVMLAGRGTELFATWSNFTSTGTVSTSVNDGGSWTALPTMDIGGRNYCPDLGFDDSTGDLLYLNEPGRRMFRRVDAMPWALVGSVGAGSGYTDFAVGGPWAYATGSTQGVSRSPTARGAVFTVETQSTVGTRGSMDADRDGNLFLARPTTPTTVTVHRWSAASPTIDAGIDLTVPSGMGFTALGSPPAGDASVTAIFSSTAEPIRVHVQAY